MCVSDDNNDEILIQPNLITWQTMFNYVLRYHVSNLRCGDFIFAIYVVLCKWALLQYNNSLNVLFNVGFILSLQCIHLRDKKMDLQNVSILTIPYYYSSIVFISNPFCVCVCLEGAIYCNGIAKNRFMSGQQSHTHNFGLAVQSVGTIWMWFWCHRWQEIYWTWQEIFFGWPILFIVCYFILTMG